MPLCCPPGHGCNSSTRAEPCVLELCRRFAAEEPRAALVLDRWERWQQAGRRGVRKRERRFRRRAYERAREDALGPLLMRSQPTSPVPRRSRPEQRPAREEQCAESASGPHTRLGVLLGQHRLTRRR